MNPYKVVSDFEETIAEYAGSEYAVAVESGTAAIFLSLYRRQWELGELEEVFIPKFTYPSVPCSIIHWGGRVMFKDDDWHGSYELSPLRIIDGALVFRRGMYKGGLHCLSFHAKKHLPIGRGGMILTDDKETYSWLKKARFDGRGECELKDDDIGILGFNMYLMPEQAARGLMLFNAVKGKKLADLKVSDQGYINLAKIKAYQ